MKKLILAMIPALFVTSNAFAVETKNCPEVMVLTYQSVRIHSDKKLRENIGPIDNQDWAEVLFEEAREVRDNFKQVQESDIQDLELLLIDKKSGRCTYTLNGEAASRENETRLFSRNGRDILRVSIQVNGENYWIYHSVIQYSTEGVLVKPHGVVAGGFENQAPRTEVAWAYNLETSTP